jgi:predicted amidohydrolase YtcJ
VNIRIFTAQHVYTSVLAPPAGNALASMDGRVIAVGDGSQLQREFPAADVVDFGNAVITPGLTDAHIHITEWALARRQVHLDAATTVDECLAIIADASTHHAWLQGRGWNPHRWGGTYPDRHQLDRVAADRPAAFQSHDMHALWVNSAALDAAGIDRNTPDPEGGRIVRSADGEATGMLLETAAQLVVSRIPRVTDAEIQQAVLEAQGELHSHGITGIHSFPGVHLPEPDPLPVLQGLAAKKLLALRVLQHIAADKLSAAIALGLRSGFGGDWMRIGAVKMFLDGALGSRTAWMLEPYENSDNVGVQVLQRADFEGTVMRAADAGIATTVHAIGDAAVAMAFDVLARAPRVAALPHRVEHVQCLPAQAVPMLEQGIVCSVQPCHLMTDWRAADQHWGKRGAATYAFRTMSERGAVLACGSDAPVESVDPRLGLYAAVARRDTRHEPDQGWYGEQCIPTRDVLAGYTLGAAVAAGAEGIQGVLHPGAFADFAVWRTDPLACTPVDLLGLQVAATVVNGSVVFEAQGS